MKQMSLIEMDGFLKGKCIPSDLKVNETNAEYLVRKFAEAEAKCAELEGKDSKIANLTAERDALREGEMGDARHSNTRAAADIYFQLVEECEIPAGGSLVEYVDDMREKLEAAEKRIAELEAREVVLPRAHDVHPLGPQSAKIFCEFHRSIVNRCADEIRKVGVKVSIKGN